MPEDQTSGSCCAHCGEAIERPAAAWREVRVWVSPDGGKGSRGALNTGRLMHESCMHVERSGVAPGQERLGG